MATRLLSRSEPVQTSDAARNAYTRQRVAHWDAVALSARYPTGRYYHRRLAQIYQHLVSPGLRVLELGCGTGDLLESLRPAIGVGVDFSGEMVRLARNRHPHLTFLHLDVHDLAVEGEFDVVILSDLVNDLWDVQGALERARSACNRSSRLLVNTYSRLWEPPLGLAQKLGLARPMLRQNWLGVADLENLLQLSGFETLRTFQDVLLPIGIPVLRSICNRFLVKLWFFRKLALTNFIVARPRPTPLAPSNLPRVSVIVPARNEAGNIEQVLVRVPQMGRGTEIVFVEGHSTDGTYDIIQRSIAARPDLQCQLRRQTGRGKGEAVRMGFSVANGEMLMILDADLTVPPEDLRRFYEALLSGQGDVINGVRLVYPMEDRAMRFLNLVGNKFFSVAFSWLLGQPIKDTLCGTKVLWKQDYARIATNRPYFGDFDPFGDFDLIFGAVKQNLKVIDLPIRYRERTYGRTNIERFRHGVLLLRMLVLAAVRIKFV